jgi:multiple sugar transport system ATP-binding protein
VIVGIRPEDIEDAAIAGEAEGRSLPALAELVEPLGADLIAHLSIDVPPPSGHEHLDELARDAGTAPLPGQQGTSSLVARLSPRSAVGGGFRAVVTVDTERLHLFAPDSGAAIWDLGTEQSVRSSAGEGV